MSLFDFPRRVLSNLPLIGGAGARGEDDRDPDRGVWIEPVGDQQDADPAAEIAEDPEDDADEDVDDESEDEADDDPEEDVDEDPEEEVDEDDSGGDGDGDEGETEIGHMTAPSIGPHTTFEKDDPRERLARHEQSDVDAMGLEKRREVIGGSYSPSVVRQLTTYGIVLAVIGAIVAGFVLLANKLDAAPDKYDDAAPWSQADAEQVKPTQIDFPNYGHPGPGESSQSTPGGTSGSSSSENVVESQD